ncbi:MAG: cyclic nucleotide-binding domain-containing protein [Desulfuromonadaceae bacterium]
MAQSGASARQRAEMLERIPWLADLSWQELETLARYFKVSRATKGITIFREGDRDSYLGLIAEGRVQVIKRDDHQQAKILAILGPGKVFGEMMLIDGEPRSATIVAAEPATLLLFSRDSLDTLIEEFPRLAAKFLCKLCALLSQRLRRTSGQLVDLIE